jgi:intracellular sulfur oxidation DsrE/DsrF family protein
VKIYVCGQAVADNNIAYTDIAPQVTLTLSALTDLVILQKEGYALEPL